MYENLLLCVHTSAVAAYVRHCTPATRGVLNTAIHTVNKYEDDVVGASP